MAHRPGYVGEHAARLWIPGPPQVVSQVTQPIDFLGQLNVGQRC